MAGAQSLSEFHSKASSNHCSHGPTTSRFSPVTSPAERAISNDTSELKLQSVTSSCSPHIKCERNGQKPPPPRSSMPPLM